MNRLLLLCCLFLSYSANANDVVFYPDCDYRGQSVALAPGDYTARELQQVGIPQDAISSIEVPRGLAVTVYENDNFSGRHGTLRRSDPCLVNDRFDNLISSVSIRETLDTVVQPLPSAGSDDSLVTFYTDCNYTGRSASFDVGSYNFSALQQSGLPNNSISSIKVPQGYTVTLYDHDFLRGKAGRLQRNDACLANDNFDNITSSLSIERDASAVITPPKKPTTPTVSVAPVTVFSQCNYAGSKLPLKEGKYTSEDLRALGLKNNSISSIQVNNGYQIELFENDFYRGRSGTLRQNDACLIDDRFNDVISSVVVTKNPYANEEIKAEAEVATVYGFCNFKGGSVELTEGRYDAADLANKGISDNRISSLKVLNGYKVTVFEDANFQGKKAEFIRKDTCLDDEGLDDAVSSLIVEKLEATKNDPFKELVVPTVQQQAQVSQMDNALGCIKEYVNNGVCDSIRWPGMVQRCNLEDITLMTDGYLKGHIDAGNCRTELWDELARRVANPRLR